MKSTRILAAIAAAIVAMGCMVKDEEPAETGGTTKIEEKTVNPPGAHVDVHTQPSSTTTGGTTTDTTPTTGGTSTVTTGK